MRLTLNPWTALLLRFLLFPLVLVIRLIKVLTGKHKPVYTSTIAENPLEYRGDKPLLIAVWDESASIWTAATAGVVEQLRAEFAGACEFAYVEASSRTVTEAFGAKIVPVLILRHRGTEVKRFVNTMEVEEVRPALQAIANQRRV